MAWLLPPSHTHTHTTHTSARSHLRNVYLLGGVYPSLPDHLCPPLWELEVSQEFVSHSKEALTLIWQNNGQVCILATCQSAFVLWPDDSVTRYHSRREAATCTDIWAKTDVFFILSACAVCVHVTRAQWKQSHLRAGTACNFSVPALGVLAFLSRCLYTLLCRSGARRSQPNRSTPNNEKYFRISSPAASQHKELPGAWELEPGGELEFYHSTFFILFSS